MQGTLFKISIKLDEIGVGVQEFLKVDKRNLRSKNYYIFFVLCEWTITELLGSKTLLAWTLLEFSALGKIQIHAPSVVSNFFWKKCDAGTHQNIVNLCVADISVGIVEIILGSKKRKSRTALKKKKEAEMRIKVNGERKRVRILSCWWLGRRGWKWRTLIWNYNFSVTFGRLDSHLL